MFQINDKITLCLINASDIDGNFLPFQLQLPLKNKEFELPENIASIDLFEYTEGPNPHGSIVYSLNIGKRTTFKELVDSEDSQKLLINKKLNISSLDNLVCYQVSSTETTKEKIVYTILREQDIVLENKEQLKTAIEVISEEFAKTLEQIDKIKKPSLKKALNPQPTRIVRF